MSYEWISVEDGLPKDGRWVRAKKKNGAILEKVALVWGGRFWLESRKVRLDKVHRDIVGWQEITPPKEKI